MFQFMDNNYRQAIMALKQYHNRKSMFISSIIVFLTFTIVILIMLMDKGLLMVISIPISVIITFIYIHFMRKDFKKKLLLTRVNIKKLLIKMDQNILFTETVFSESNIVHSQISLDKIIKVVETNRYYFLYDKPISAIILNKQALTTKNEQALHTFLHQKFKVKHAKRF